MPGAYARGAGWIEVGALDQVRATLAAHREEAREIEVENVATVN